ncbi:MAG: hypothetical protein CM15mP84_01310 [Cellvibrionales bacterium]|nr:MAG: hypothetical protein CM15mP84_01310 [Cellvibrionales bacterium]
MSPPLSVRLNRKAFYKKRCSAEKQISNRMLVVYLIISVSIEQDSDSVGHKL